jgi:uncharacterized membrane protein affecting hemolysin expression
VLDIVLLKVGDGLAQQVYIILEATNASIAVQAEQLAHTLATRPTARTAGVIVVNRKGSTIRVHATTDGTTTTLINHHLIVLVGSDAVLTPKPRGILALLALIGQAVGR